MGTSICYDTADHKNLSMNGSATLDMLAKRISRSIIKQEPITTNYIVGDIIGRGKFAVVKKVMHLTSGQTFAAKFIRRRRKGTDCIDEILQEIAMLELARCHRRLIGMVEAYETLHEVIVVTEFAAGGELFQLCDGIGDQFTEPDAANIVRQVLEGLHFLHCQNIVHLDVKPQNILLTELYPKGEVKVCDFTSSRVVGADEDVKIIFGTPDYVAPEVLQYEPISTATDIWSLGVVVYVLLTGHSPFGGNDKQETFLNITEVNLAFPEELFAGVSESAQDFIRACLLRDPSDRPTALECLDHVWLRGQHADNIVAAARASSRLSCDQAKDAPEKPLRGAACGASMAAQLQELPSTGSSPQKRYRRHEGGPAPACSLDRDNDGAKLPNPVVVAAVAVSAVPVSAELVCN